MHRINILLKLAKSSEINGFILKSKTYKSKKDKAIEREQFIWNCVPWKNKLKLNFDYLVWHEDKSRNFQHSYWLNLSKRRSLQRAVSLMVTANLSWRRYYFSMMSGIIVIIIWYSKRRGASSSSSFSIRLANGHSGSPWWSCVKRWWILKLCWKLLMDGHTHTKGRRQWRLG